MLVIALGTDWVLPYHTGHTPHNQQGTEMNKTTKASLAAGGAAVLLLGGVGSLAYWTDDATVDAGSINSGFLTLDAGTCGAGWTYVAGGAPVVNFVPGDVVTRTCTFVVGAEGDNLSAAPTMPETLDVTVTPEGAQGGSGASFSATVDATYTLDNVAFDNTDLITEANDGDVLAAAIVVTIPRGTDETGTPLVNANDTKNIVASLEDLTVTLVQQPV